jgi:hypothetical protein
VPMVARDAIVPACPAAPHWESPTTASSRCPCHHPLEPASACTTLPPAIQPPAASLSSYDDRTAAAALVKPEERAAASGRERAAPCASSRGRCT